MVVLSMLILMVTSSTLAMGPAYKIASRREDNGDARKCPIHAALTNLDLKRFYGDWYVLEYEYPRELHLRDISCVGMHYAPAAFGEELIANFTFRFPATTGFFYHVPTFSTIRSDSNAIWETQFKHAHLSSVVAATDYINWAVLVQCSLDTATDVSKFLSTRVLARQRSLSAKNWLEIEAAIDAADADAPFRYPIQQNVCQEMDQDL